MEQLIYAIPGIVLVVIGAFVWLHGVGEVGLALLGAGVLATVAGLYLMVTTPAHISGIDRVQGWVLMTLRSRSLPYDRSSAAAVHGVESILDDGSVAMADGRIVRFARLQGRNTDLQSSDEEQVMINSLRRGIDNAGGADFSIYSTSTLPDPRDITENYREVWLNEWDEEDGDASDTRGYLESIIDWEPEMCEVSMATEWEHYLIVSVSPHEIDTPPVASTDATSRQQQQQVEAERRLEKLRQAFGSAGVEAHPVGGAAHARVIARHWAGAQHPFHVDDEFDRSPVSIWPDYDTERLISRLGKRLRRPINRCFLGSVLSFLAILNRLRSPMGGLKRPWPDHSTTSGQMAT